MDCSEVRERLELFVLGELADEELAEIRAHLGGCPGCRELEADYRCLLGELKRLGTGEVPAAGLVQRIEAAGRAELGRGVRRRWVRRAVAAVGSVAALLLLWFGAWSIWSERDGERGDAGAGAERWRYTGAQATPTSMADELLVRDRVLYLLRRGRFGAGVSAIDAATGLPRWQSETPTIGYLAADDARVFCLASIRPNTLDLVALDASDGVPIWRYSCGAVRPRRDACRPVSVGGDRVCWTAGTEVHLLDAATGGTKWVRRIPKAGQLSRVASRGDRLYVAGADGLHCLDAGSGEPVCGRAFAGVPSGVRRPQLALGPDRVYVVQDRPDGDSQLLSFSLCRSGHRLMWQRRVRKVQHLLFAAGTLYLRTTEVCALDGQTGRRLWAHPAVGCGPLTRVHGLIHFADASEGGRLVALSERTGAEMWVIAGLRSCTGFTGGGRTGYIKTLDGVVHAIALVGRRR